MNYIIKKMIVMIIVVIVMKLEISLKNLKKQKILKMNLKIYYQ